MSKYETIFKPPPPKKAMCAFFLYRQDVYKRVRK